MAKTRLNLSLDQDLVDFAKGLAAENRTSVADIVTQYLLALKRRSEGDAGMMVLSHPTFRKAMKDAQERLRTGAAEWHDFDEVFVD